MDPEEKKKWLDERRKGIGGSDSPVVLLGEYFGKTRKDLFLEKTGQVSPEELDKNPDVRRGTRQEPIAAALYQEITGNKVRKVNRILTHPEKPFMLANIDREILGMDGAILEIKCPRAGVFRKWQMEGIPEGPQIQGNHYMAVKRKGLVVFAIFCAELDEMMVVPVERDQELIDYIEDADTNFWNLVEAGEFTEQETQEKLELPPVGGEVITIDHPDWEKAVQSLRTAKELKADAEELEAEAKAKVQSIMEEREADVVQGAGARVYWKWRDGKASVDAKRLQREEPDIYQRYLKRGKPFRVFRPYLDLKGADA